MGTSTTERAMTLLGSGIGAETVASALGVSPSYISQLLSDENFSKQVSDLKFAAISKHTDRDIAYDDIEDRLIEKLGKNLQLIMRPSDILGAIKVINSAKRRGIDSTDAVVDRSTIVNIMLPTQILQQFTTNMDNQVIKTGEQDLLTMASGDLLKKADPTLDPRNRKIVAEEKAAVTNTTNNINALEGDLVLASI